MKNLCTRKIEGYTFSDRIDTQLTLAALDMARRGDPYNNAVAENFFSCLKCELVHLKQYLTHIEAQTDIFATSRHSTTLRVPILPLVWMSPAHFETAL